MAGTENPAQVPCGGFHRGKEIHPTLTRRDLSQAMGFMSRYVQAPHTTHLDVGCTVRYI